MTSKKNAIIVSASSDIGTQLSLDWLEKGYSVHGTYRSKNDSFDLLQNHGCNLFYCDLSDISTINRAIEKITAVCSSWDYLIFGPGVQDPIGDFPSISFNEWTTSIDVNFTNQLRLLHLLLPFRSKNIHYNPVVLFFAGGGTNNATVRYSAYTISKIALIKMCELLDAEIPDTSFTILGPGWVKTKIHQSTLKAKQNAGSNYVKTVEKLKSQECTPMHKVIECINWLVSQNKEVISGRNFSVVFDQWGSKKLINKLLDNENMYKLRRHNNDWK